MHSVGASTISCRVSTPGLCRPCTRRIAAVAHRGGTAQVLDGLPSIGSMKHSRCQRWAKALALIPGPRHLGLRA